MSVQTADEHGAGRAGRPAAGGAGTGTAFGLQLGQVNHAMPLYAPCPVAIVPERE
ncbi:hypothetical protein [Streptomyces sp. NPDC058595]|uniref:hypothetical protein n=1 Tax=Streptomyces sp. NPDC058595 TaxID=3346550 RepID=UPI00365EB9EC